MYSTLRRIFDKEASSQKRSQFAALSSTQHQSLGLNTSGYPSFAQSYERNVIVHRCVTLIARSIGSVPWRLFAHDKRTLAHPLLSLLEHPNPTQGRNIFVESVMSYLLLSGNAYIEAVKSPDGRPFELYALRPDRLRIIPGKHGLPQSYEYHVQGSKKAIPCGLDGIQPILHLKFFHPENDWYGLSPIEAALQSIHLHNTVAQHNLSLLKNGGRPSGALFINTANGQPLTPEQRQELRDSLSQIHQGTQNAGQMMILEGGSCQWQEMGMSPKDMDFSEGRNMAAREIAQVFGVPPMLVGIPGDATFSNYKEARLHLWEDTILPLLGRLINQFNTWLVPQFGSGLSLTYDPDAIPTLGAKREAMWERVDACSFLTNNEKREAVGYPPIDDNALPKKAKS
jgi:HK97 family phage portal protein